MQNKIIGTIKVVSTEDLQDGKVKVVFDADEEFKENFKKHYNLKRWSKKIFNEFVNEAIKNTIRIKLKNEETKNKEE